MTLMALSGIANVGGGLLGDLFSGGDRKNATDQMKGIADLYKNISTPDIESQKLNLQQYGPGAQEVAKQDTASQLGSQDALQNIALDPRLKNTQMSALDTLKHIAGAGFTPDELNSMTSQRQKNEGDLTSALKGIDQQNAMRGISGGGGDLASKLLAAQSSANRGAEDQRALQSQGFQRSLNAISQGANLAGSMENADYGRQANLANALNSRELTNMQQKAMTNASNVDRFNRALEHNVGRENTTADKNTGLLNQQQQYNKGLQQQQFQNQMQKAAGQAGASKDLSTMYNNQANRTATKYSGVGAGLGDIFNSAATRTTPKIDRDIQLEPEAVDWSQPKNPYTA